MPLRFLGPNSVDRLKFSMNSAIRNRACLTQLGKATSTEGV